MTANGNDEALPKFDLSKPIVTREAWESPEPRHNKVAPKKERKKALPPVYTDDDMIACRKCRQVKPYTEYKSSGEYPHLNCKPCRQAKARADNARAAKRRLDVKRIKLDILTRSEQLSCSRCGYDEFIEALEFHHNNQKQKDSTVSQLISRYALSPTEGNMERLMSEVGRCSVLCSNCHQALHAKAW